jgi:hypothetical protein
MIDRFATRQIRCRAMVWGVWLSSILFCLILVRPLPLPAARPDAPPDRDRPKTDSATEAPETDPPERVTPRRAIMDTAHHHISNSLISSAEWFDAFFDDERYDSEVNESRLKLSFESSVINGEGIKFDANTHLKIVLPELEERLSFEISGDTDDEIRDDRPVDADLKDTVDDDRDRGGLTAGFRYLLTAKERLNIHIKSGARIRSFEPVAYIGPRYRQTFDFVAPWDLRLTQRIRWYSDDGWETGSRVDLERGLFEDYFFRATTEVKWYEAEKGLFYDLDFTLSRALDARTAIEFQWNNRFKTRPHNQLSTTFFRFRLRRRILRDWLSLEVGPQIAYPRERDYNFTPGVLFKFSVVFGFYTKTGFY